MRGFENGHNPAAGRRCLGAREHVRMHEDITEVLCRALRGDERVIVMARLLSEIHNDFRAIEAGARSANERASGASFEPPVVASMVGQCWEWHGRKAKGYGVVQIGHRRTGAHRFIYELLVGNIPAGLQLDHLCRNKACVNPAHLEVVTSRENTLRGVGVSARNAQKTHCIHGHPLSGENLYIQIRDNAEHRQCKECRRAVNRRGRYWDKTRSAA